MKKVVIIMSTFVLALILVGCTTSKVEIPDLIGMDYSDVIRWAADVEINLNVTSEYNDDVKPNSIISQSLEAGSKVAMETEMDIVYSRGFDPNGEVTIPDFTGKTKVEIVEWLSANDVKKYHFQEAFDLDLAEGTFVGYEAKNSEDRTTTLRKDTYYFYFSKGTLEVEDIEFDNRYTVRGVNFGGWFVLEGWMTPDLFEGVEGSDETVFLQEKPNAEVELENHWDTFITEDDFKWLSDNRIDYIRLPIPWWLFGVENAYEGTDLEVDYPSSLFYIDRAMVWAEEYDIQVLLDLHTAPGCQNGFDNGGISGVQEWGKNESTTNYVATTVDVIDQIAEHFIQYDSLWGIEVLNEPGWGVNMTVLQNYYLDSYDVIRAHDANVWIGFHDGFRGYDENAWKPFFQNNDFTNVFFDIHLYQVFGDGWGDFDIFDHLEWVEVEQTKATQRYEGIVPTIVGEWSLGLQGNVYEDLNYESTNTIREAFAAAQMNVYEDNMGWFFWNYKIDANSHLEWDFRRLVEAGLIPDDYSTKY